MIAVGSNNITSLKVGTSDVTSIYLGTNLVYSGGSPTPTPLGEYEVRLTMTGGTTSSVTYSNGVIPNNAFENRFDIVKVEMGSGITSIGDGAFYRCSGITQVEFGESVTDIGLYAFWYCTSVSSATLWRSSLVSVDEFGLAFHSSAITYIEFPTTLTSLGNNSMRGCSNLTEINCTAEYAPTLGTNVFVDYPSQGTLYVPYGSDYSSWIGTGATSGDKLAAGWDIEYGPCEEQPCEEGYHWDSELCNCEPDGEPCEPDKCGEDEYWDDTQCSCVPYEQPCEPDEGCIDYDYENCVCNEYEETNEEEPEE